MSVNKNENRRIPGFTAENTLEQRVATPYAGLAQNRAGGGAVEPVLKPRCPYLWTYDSVTFFSSEAACLAAPAREGGCYKDFKCGSWCWCP